MGFLSKFKKLFSKEENTEKVKEEEIPGWIKKKNQEVSLKMQSEKEDFYISMQNNLNELEIAAKNLKNADLSERKVDERIRAFSEAGRRDYLNAISIFLDEFRERKSAEEVSSYLTRVINNFIKLSEKADFKATQIIGKEIEEIRKIVKSIREKTEHFLKKNKETMKIKAESDKIILDMQEILEKKEIIQNYEEEIKAKNQDIEEKTRKEKSIEEEISAIKNSDNYLQEEREEKELKEKKEQIKSLEIQAKNLVDMRILEKFIYYKIDPSRESLIKEYIENPASALIKDDSLKIGDVISEIIDKAKRGAISLKENEIKKLSFDRERAKEVRHSIKKANEDIERIIKNTGNLAEKIQEKQRDAESLRKIASNEQELVSKIEQKIKVILKEIENQENENREKIQKEYRIEIILN